jgi:hypothetical protein
MNRRASLPFLVGVFGGVVLVACSNASSPSTATPISAQSTQAVATVQAAASPVRINAVQTSGSDAAVVVQNTSPSAVDLTGWQLSVGGASAALPSGMNVAPGDTLTLHTASGTSTSSNVYIGGNAQNLSANLRPGAQVILQSPSGPVTAFTVPGT